MATYRLTNDQAFALLTTLSQNTNRNSRELAAGIVLTGALPNTVSRAPSDQ